MAFGETRNSDRLNTHNKQYRINQSKHFYTFNIREINKQVPHNCASHMCEGEELCFWALKQAVLDNDVNSLKN